MKVEEKISKKHSLNLIERERLMVSGIKEVFSFDETLIELETTKGYLNIEGEDLHIIKMNIDEGDLAIEGNICEMHYHDNQGPGKKKGSMIAKLFK